MHLNIFLSSIVRGWLSWVVVWGSFNLNVSCLGKFRNYPYATIALALLFTYLMFYIRVFIQSTCASPDDYYMTLAESLIILSCSPNIPYID